MTSKHEQNELQQLQIFLEEINSVLEKKLQAYDPINNKDALSADTIDELLQENTLLEQSISLLETEHEDVLDSFQKIRKTQEKYQRLYHDTFKKYHDLYEYSPILYRSIDPFGRIVNCNLAYAKSLGYSKTDVINSSIFKHIADKDMDKMKHIFERWRETGKIEPVQIWMKRKDGTTFPALLQARTVFSEDGKVLGSNTAIQDISEIYNLTQQLEKTNEKLEQELKKTEMLSRTKDEFMTMITHELKTPLVPIKGYCDLMMQGKLGQLSDENKNRLKIIQKSADSLLNLVTNLLDAQKIELGEFTINRKRINLSSLVQNFIESMSPVFSKNISCIQDVQSEIYCNGDKQRLEQVLSNIIGNAVDFCSDNNGIVKVSLKQKDNNALLFISDNGIGLTNQGKKEIFQKFYQTDRSLTRKHGGTGLGLSICKGIIESHHGTIWAESEGVGKGTTICISLPLCE